MTMTGNRIPRDRPVVTPAMKDAGVLAYERFRESYDDWALVEAVYIAMEIAGRVRRTSRPSKICLDTKRAQDEHK